MATPPKQLTTISTRLDKPTYNQLVRLAMREKRSLSTMLLIALERYIEAEKHQTQKAD